MSYFWRAFKVNSFSAFYQGWCVALISLDAWVWNTLATLSTGANQDKLNLGNSMHARTHTCTHLPRGIKNGIIFGVNGMLLSLTESYIFWTEINHTKRQLVVQENTHSLWLPCILPKLLCHWLCLHGIFQRQEKRWKSDFKVKDLYREQCHLLAFPECIVNWSRDNILW